MTRKRQKQQNSDELGIFDGKSGTARDKRQERERTIPLLRRGSHIHYTTVPGRSPFGHTWSDRFRRWTQRKNSSLFVSETPPLISARCGWSDASREGESRPTFITLEIPRKLCHGHKLGTATGGGLVCRSFTARAGELSRTGGTKLPESC